MCFILSLCFSRKRWQLKRRCEWRNVPFPDYCVLISPVYSVGGSSCRVFYNSCLISFNIVLSVIQSVYLTLAPNTAYSTQPESQRSRPFCFSFVNAWQRFTEMFQQHVECVRCFRREDGNFQELFQKWNKKDEGFLGWGEPLSRQNLLQRRSQGSGLRLHNISLSYFYRTMEMGKTNMANAMITILHALSLFRVFIVPASPAQSMNT